MPKATITRGKSTKLSVAQKLQAIGQRRRRGDVSIIAAKTGYDRSHVSRVLSGVRNNVRIVDAAYSHMSKRKVKTA